MTLPQPRARDQLSPLATSLAWKGLTLDTLDIDLEGPPS